MAGDLGLDELHRWLAENEPKYLIPRYLERRESFPKTPSERIQKHRLKDLPSTALVSSTTKPGTEK